MLGDGNLVVKSRPRSEMRFCSVFRKLSHGAKMPTAGISEHASGSCD